MPGIGHGPWFGVWTRSSFLLCPFRHQSDWLLSMQVFHFFSFVVFLKMSFIVNFFFLRAVDVRPSLLKRDLRQQLFILFAGWSGKFGRPFGFNSSSAAKEQEPSELELTAVEAMSSVLCCGPCFNRQGLTEDNHSDVYSWLDILLASKNEKVILS